MGKALGMLLATTTVLVSLAAWPSEEATPTPAVAVETPLEAIAAANVLDRDGMARERRFVEAAASHANARLNCVVDPSSPDWTTSLWTENGRGRRVAFRTLNTLFPDDPHVYLIVVDLDDAAAVLGTNVLFR